LVLWFENEPSGNPVGNSINLAKPRSILLIECCIYKFNIGVVKDFLSRVSVLTMQKKTLLI
jgi:hypothetical protein